jgi:hypothetical protein
MDNREDLEVVVVVKVVHFPQDLVIKVILEEQDPATLEEEEAGLVELAVQILMVTQEEQEEADRLIQYQDQIHFMREVAADVEIVLPVHPEMEVVVPVVVEIHQMELMVLLP